MSHRLTCGCTLCARLLAGYDWAVAEATQEDLLCDQCRTGICAGSLYYAPSKETIARIRTILLGESLA